MNALKRAKMFLAVLGRMVPQMIRDMNQQRLRTCLTTFGIMWGTLSVGLLLAFGQGLHHKMVKDIRGLGNGIVIAWPSTTSKPFEGLGKGRRIRFTEDDMALIRARVDNLKGIASEYHEELKLRYRDKTVQASVVGTLPEFEFLRNMVPEAGGRFINHLDEVGQRRVAFFGDKLAREVFGTQDPIGRTVTLGDSPFLVIGVLKHKEQDSNYNGRDENHLFVPGATLRTLAGRKYLDNFIFQAKNVAGTEALKGQIHEILARKHRFDRTDKEALQIWDTTEMFQFMDAFMLAFKLFLGIVGSLTLVVGGIGVSNIMNVVVEERTREIGIKMALGARRRWILLQFLFESLIIVGLGGLVGLYGAQGVCLLLGASGVQEFVGVPKVSPPLAFLTIGILGAVGLTAGYFPARSAAKLDPVVAMKM